LSLAVGTPPGAALDSRSTPRYQYGINTYVTYNCQGLATYLGWAATEVAQYKALGANTIALAFPLYMPSITSNDVSARLRCGDPKYQSPPIGLLTKIVEAAHAAGLKVLLRPLIDQQNFFRQSPTSWRGVLAPTNPNLWFQNYWRAVEPFLAMAQATHVEHFAIASELNSIADAKNWTPLISRSRAMYKGDITFDYSWQTPVTKSWKPYTSLSIDAYPELLDTSMSQTPAQLLGQWNLLLRTRPAYTIPDITRVAIDEIGIPAQVGAYAKPFEGSFPLATHPFNQSVQVRWYTAACAFMKQHHMRGIYYFGPWMGSHRGSLLTSPSSARPSDIQPAAQRSIRGCFS
jgi:hypothetical protein